MLHIILLILKIIGIIIAAILGILVLLICVFLFVPVQYELAAECDGTHEGSTAYFRCRWLLGLLRMASVYKDKTFKWKLNILWLSFPKEEEQTLQEIKEEVNRHEEKLKDTVETVEKEKKEPEYSEQNSKSMAQETEKKPGLRERAEKKRQEAAQVDEEETSRFSEKYKKFTNIVEKCRQTYEKIKCTIHRIYDKIQSLCNKKEILVEFIQDDVHLRAFGRLKREGIRLLKRLMPYRIRADVHYGFEDPCTTGQVLAGLSAMYPFMSKHVHVVPDFENRILEGNLHIKGKIRGIYFLLFVWNLWRSKEIRTTYKDVRNFKFS